MADRQNQNNPSNTSGGSRDQGSSGTLGGAGAGLLDCYVQNGFVYNAKTNTQIGRITEKSGLSSQGGSSSFGST